ncbi:glycoside hydrolase family 25 protein [Nocardia nepalensis]|uniref:glycoside hydrolase family 25 protein n=1 Tax=Nocardia nepalensis TaxID=3375448 RepID=UPI003B67F4C1
MTIFGIDISNNNGPDIDLARVKAEGFDFVFAKVSEGDYFVDHTWPAYRDAAEANGLLLAGYHYVRADCGIEEQADLFVSHLGNAPAMLDFEANSGDMSTFWALCDAIDERGVQVRLSYIPRWYAMRLGSPDLSKVPGLIQSSYVGGTGYAADLYPGDTSPYWNGFCDRAVDVLQFTDAAQVAGHTVDADAFRGSLDDLRRLLGSTPPTSNGVLMALTDAQQADLYQKVQDIWSQLLGPAGDGWTQLGTNAHGQNLTLVDAVAKLSAATGSAAPKAAS